MEDIPDLIASRRIPLRSTSLKGLLINLRKKVLLLIGNILISRLSCLLMSPGEETLAKFVGLSQWGIK